jgi:hypothetical protein
MPLGGEDMRSIQRLVLSLAFVWERVTRIELALSASEAERFEVPCAFSPPSSS